jgi:hypothetical protein
MALVGTLLHMLCMCLEVVDVVPADEAEGETVSRQWSE